VVDHNHEIELAAARARLAEVQAQRARLERHADPVVGVRTVSERDCDEQSVGVFISIPLGSGPAPALPMSVPARPARPRPAPRRCAATY